MKEKYNSITVDGDRNILFKGTNIWGYFLLEKIAIFLYLKNNHNIFFYFGKTKPKTKEEAFDKSICLN